MATPATQTRATVNFRSAGAETQLFGVYPAVMAGNASSGCEAGCGAAERRFPNKIGNESSFIVENGVDAGFVPDVQAINGDDRCTGKHKGVIGSRSSKAHGKTAKGKYESGKHSWELIRLIDTIHADGGNYRRTESSAICCPASRTELSGRSKYGGKAIFGRSASAAPLILLRRLKCAVYCLAGECAGALRNRAKWRPQ